MSVSLPDSHSFSGTTDGCIGTTHCARRFTMRRSYKRLLPGVLAPTVDLTAAPVRRTSRSCFVGWLVIGCSCGMGTVGYVGMHSGGVGISCYGSGSGDPLLPPECTTLALLVCTTVLLTTTRWFAAYPPPPVYLPPPPLLKRWPPQPWL